MRPAVATAIAALAVGADAIADFLERHRDNPGQNDDRTAAEAEHLGELMGRVDQMGEALGAHAGELVSDTAWALIYAFGDAVTDPKPGFFRAYAADCRALAETAELGRVGRAHAYADANRAANAARAAVIDVPNGEAYARAVRLVHTLAHVGGR